MLWRTIAHQAVLLIIRHVSSRIVLEEQYLFNHLGDCMVLKQIFFVFATAISRSFAFVSCYYEKF